MEAAASLLNGERAVVVMFLSRIVMYAESSVLYESLALVLLAVCALVVETRAEAPGRISSLKTRPGASCGVMLGAVTLPAVLVSKMIQQSRGYLLGEIELEGLLATLKLFYVFCHGFAAVKVIQHIIHTFFSCASIGEALLVTSGLIHYFGDMIACTVTEICRRLVSSGLVSAQFGINRSEISTIIQGTLFGLLLFPFLFKFLVRIWGHFSSSFNLDSRKYEIGRALVFYVFLSFIVIGIIPMWMQFVQEFSRHPILWIVGFVFSEPYKRLSLCIHWVGLIGVAVLRFYSISKHSKVERILLRKYYHLLAVCMFVPALIYQPMFLDLAFGAALAVFLVLEIIRIWRIWPLGQLVHKFMTAFTDHRDSDILIVSHFSLLLGCALPIWMSSQYNDRPLALFAGILILGIGDTMASMVGHKYGVLRWSKTGKKTIEGTAAGITSMLAASLSLLPLLASTGYLVTESWFPLVFAVTVSGLLEAYTAQLDNAFIPLVFYSLLCL
uniref:dolichol kinase n=1 Tax=Kalanchoe fedtschenkoi TaxID=63787 RepID=A0A7N0TLP2_KALFE